MLKYFLPFLLVFGLSFCSAQNNPIFDLYTVNDGLAQTTINDMIQDKNGFLWIGTDGGLCRFDGYNFKNYKRNANNKHAFNSDRGIHFFNDSQHRLWLVSYNGISLYRSEQDDFLNLLTFDPKNAITTYNRFFGEDERYIWGGLSDYGLFKIDKQTLKIEKVLIPGISFAAEHTTWYKGFLEKGKLWIINNDLFLIYDTRTKKVQRPPLPLFDIVSYNAKQAIGIMNGRAVSIDKNRLTAKILPISTSRTTPVLSLYRLANRQIMFSVDNVGAVFYDPNTNKIIQTIATANEGLIQKKLRIAVAYQDWSGNIWMHWYGEGLRKLNYNAKKFMLYRSPDPKANGIYSVSADETSVYAGTARMGISVFSKKSGFEKQVNYTAINPLLNGSGFVSSSLHPAQLLVLGYTLDGSKSLPFLYHKSTGKIALLPKQILAFYQRHWPSGDFRKFVVKDNQNTLLSNVGSYLIALKQQGETLVVDTLKKFDGELLSCCFRDSEGQLWIGTYKNLYLQQNGRWKKIALPKAMEIKTINQDLDGNIWAGHNDGIFIIDRNHQIKTYYNEANGLKNEHIYAILSANDGNMWFSHNKGLTVFNYKNHSFRHYDEDDGLQATEFNSGAYFKAADGELFFGGINGTTSFYPEQLKDNLHAPRVKITNIALFDQPYKSEISPWEIKSLKLSYLENALSFEYAMPEYTNPTKNTYQYQMEGLDRNWVNAENRRFARYASLPPGNYTFKVKGKNNDGVWSKETTISIVIVPPFWQRLWFKLLVIVIAFSLFYLLIVTVQKIRFRRKMRAIELERKVQQERERISRDLHDNVGTQLSLISKNIDSVLTPEQALNINEQQRNLNNISLTSKEVIATLRETIWALNKAEISLEEFSDKLRAYVKKQLSVYSTTQLSYHEALDAEHTLLNPSEAIHLFRICQEAIANAIKYADATELTIRFAVQQQKYSIKISDNGNGFDTDEVDPVLNYGLDNMKFRASEIGCTFSIKSIKHQGTEIEIAKK